MKPDPTTYALAATGAAEGIFHCYIKPELTAARTWAIIGGITLAHEYFCPPGELLSQGADRLLARHPITARLGILALSLHLANLLPEKYDPVHYLTLLNRHSSNYKKGR